MFEGKPLELIIYRPGGQTGAQGAPVLLYVHGGGWVAGTKEDRSKDMRRFTD
jgi:acetyl esterase/lipase